MNCSVFQVIDIEKIIPHAQYSRRSLRNDIALIKLKSPAKMSKRVTTICLPAKGASPAVGSKNCYLSGRYHLNYFLCNLDMIIIAFS